MQAQLITAPGDGVAPAVLLSLPSGGGSNGALPPAAQYLFNVPEGFSRLVLEHKLRPGAGLRAAFACDAAALAGFGGLVMRLRGEGHEQLHVLGPQGTQAAVCSLRHFIHWRHPAVLLEEVAPWEQPTVYQDDQVEVAVLWKAPLLAAMWPAPAWLLQPQALKQSANVQTAPAASSTSSSESEGSSDSSSADGSSSSADSSSSSGDAGVSGGCSSTSGSSEEEGTTGLPPQQGAPAGSSMFDALDDLFMRGGGSGSSRRGLALQHLQQARQDKRGATNGTATAASLAPPLPAGARRAPAPQRSAATAAAQSAAAAAVRRRPTAANGTAGSTQQGPVVAAAAAGGNGGADDVAVLGGKRFRRLPGQEGINAWVCQKLATKAAAAAPAEAAGSGPPPMQQQQQQQPEVLAYLCHVKAKDQLLLVTNLHSRGAATQLLHHPALPLLLQQGKRVAAIIHLAAPGLAGSRPLQQLNQHLQPVAEAGPAGGQQLLLEQPGPSRRTQVIGHLASARTTAKLNLVSSRIFPLPAGVPAPVAPAAGPVAAALTVVRADAQTDVTAAAAAAAAAASDAAPAARGTDGGSPAQPGVAAGEPAEQQANGSGSGSLSGVVAAEVDVAAAAGSGSSPARGTGLVHVRRMSLVSWRMQEAAAVVATVATAASATAAAGHQQAEPMLLLEGSGGFEGVSCFDAAMVQQEVLEQRPLLAAELQQLQQLHTQGLLPAPEQLRAAGNSGGQCQQNQVAPPPPPPLPQPLPAGHPGAWPAALVQQQHHQQHQRYQIQQQQWPVMPPQTQQQQQQQQEPRVMRPLYKHMPATLAAPQQTGRQAAHPPLWPRHMPQQQQYQQQQPWPQAAHASANGQQPPPLLEPPQAPQLLPEVPGEAGGGPASNKRAAEGLRARLQGSKHPKPDAGAALGSSAAAAGHAQPQLEGLQPAAAAAAAAAAARGAAGAQGPEGCQQEGEQEAAWLAGAPAGIRHLAAAGSAGSLGAGGGGGGCGPEVLFLGTGSAEPSKYRAASAIQLRLSCGQSLLLDCGEGALGALCRSYGTAAALRQVASLGCVWVSHRHADHMSGVLPLLAVYPANLPPLLVVGPRSLRDWLAEAAPAQGLGSRYRFVHCTELNQPGHWARHALQHKLGITHINCVPVRHCSDAYGLVLGHEQGWSLVYSGDTQPSQQLVAAGRGCTLLIHEATFEPCLAQQARLKRHSTTAEALDVARRMEAYRVILTHFSQRYPKWPEGLPQQAAGCPAAPVASGSEAAAVAATAATAAVAFDGMRVPLALLPVLPALMPAVQAALADVEEEQAEEEGQEAGMDADSELPLAEGDS